MFHLWFNTFFVANSGDCRLSNGNDRVLDRVREPPHSCPEKEILMVKLHKHELDKANKDKTNRLYSPNFKVRFSISESTFLSFVKSVNFFPGLGCFVVVAMDYIGPVVSVVLVLASLLSCLFTTDCTSVVHASKVTADL